MAGARRGTRRAEVRPQARRLERGRWGASSHPRGTLDRTACPAKLTSTCGDGTDTGSANTAPGGWRTNPENRSVPGPETGPGQRGSPAAGAGPGRPWPLVQRFGEAEDATRMTAGQGLKTESGVEVVTRTQADGAQHRPTAQEADRPPGTPASEVGGRRCAGRGWGSSCKNGLSSFP